MKSYPMEYIDYKHILTQDERNQMSATLASKHIEIGDLKEEKKSRVSEYTAKIDARQADISLLSNQINNGYSIIPVLAEKRRNFRDKCWEWHDPNTGEVIKSEPFVGNDFQMRTDDHDYADIQQEPEVEDVSHSEVLLLGAPTIGEDTPFEDVESVDVSDDSESENTDSDDDQDEKPKGKKGGKKK